MSITSSHVRELAISAMLFNAILLNTFLGVIMIGLVPLKPLILGSETYS